MKHRICLVLMLILALPLSGHAQEHIAVSVGERTYTTDEVQKYIDASAFNMRLTLGTAVSAVYEDEAAFLEDAAEHFVTVGIMDAKLKENGMDALSAEEDASLKAYAQESYEQIWQSVADMVKESYPDAMQSERLITQTMETAGYSMDDIYENARLELMQQRLMDEYCKDIDVTDAEAQEYYYDTFVAPDKERYEGNVPLFEEEKLLTGGTSAYIPEGYFYIKYILLQPDGTIAQDIRNAQMQIDDSSAERQEAYDAMALAALNDTDTAAARTRYQAAVQAEEDAQRAFDEATGRAEEAYLPLMDIVRTAMNDGVRFEELIDRYSDTPVMNTQQEPGYPFHPDSEIWEPELHDAVAALEKYGDCTEPVYAQNSVYIVCRMDDMQCGEFEPDPDAMRQIREEMLYLRQTEKLDALVQEWRADYEIQTDISGLVFPE